MPKRKPTPSMYAISNDLEKMSKEDFNENAQLVVEPKTEMNGDEGNNSKIESNDTSKNKNESNDDGEEGSDEESESNDESDEDSENENGSDEDSENENESDEDSENENAEYEDESYGDGYFEDFFDEPWIKERNVKTITIKVYKVYRSQASIAEKRLNYYFIEGRSLNENEYMHFSLFIDDLSDAKMTKAIGIDIKEYLEFNEEKANAFVNALRDKVLSKNIIIEYQQKTKWNNIRLIKFYETETEKKAIKSVNKPKCTNCDSTDTTRCNRVNWPTKPNPPIIDNFNFDNQVEFKDYYKTVLEEKRAREAAPIVPVCKSSTRFCVRCATNCVVCEQWECENCKADKETGDCFEKYHYYIDPTIEEDCYGRRSLSDQYALDLKSCENGECNKLVCVRCRYPCSICEKIVCNSCKRRTDACKSCKFTIENNDDDCIGPIDRNSRTCEACFTSGTAKCGCGKPVDDGKEDTDSDEN